MSYNVAGRVDTSDDILVSLAVHAAWYLSCGCIEAESRPPDLTVPEVRDLTAQAKVPPTDRRAVVYLYPTDRPGGTMPYDHEHGDRLRPVPLTMSDRHATPFR